MDKMILRYVPLPHKTRGLTVQDEAGDYNIYVNSLLTYEANQETLRHELQHIDSNDFSKPLHIREIEAK